MKFSKLFIYCFCLVAYTSFGQKKWIQYVNPRIGTEKMGHTYPGATVPFGAVQLSPDTDTISFEKNGKYNPEVYKYCAGYKYEDPTIVGFSHTHFNGTGHSDLGDFLIMPTIGKLQLNPGTASNPKGGYRSAFSHDNEVVEAGYYKVLLEDCNVIAELTATKRVGMHQYTFPKSKESHIIFDLTSGIYNYEGKNIWTYVRVVNDTLITGYRQTLGWAKNRTVYFAMSFSKKWVGYGSQKSDKKETYNGFWGKFNQQQNFPEISGRNIKMYFNFETNENEKILVKMALSSVSQENALENMRSEINNWDFLKVKKQAQDDWEAELSMVQIEASEPEKINFYTALYHTYINPTIYEDVNKQYKGLDQNIHVSSDFINYTTFSLWDTYRALHPLFNILQPKRNADMVQSMLTHYNQSSLKMLPIWSHYSNDNWCMSGYHSVSVIADAIIKNNYKGDINEALTACVATANKRDYEGIGFYIDQGFIPSEKSGISVSNTLEYAYDDWCIAQIAKKANQLSVYQEFMKRSENWKNNFDETIGFMRPKQSNGVFNASFDAMSTHGQGFIEGNSWNYTFFVPHNPESLVLKMGGKNKFEKKLDMLFAMNLPDTFFAATEDITREGIIGGYVHGNEPAHHVAYLYNWTNSPWKTQATVRKILKMQYKPTPDGLGGNDDCGQMSAWYIFSSLGFYPVAPGSDKYALGSPNISKATISLENGKHVTIEAINQSENNIYVQKVLLNGKELKQNFISHKDIVEGAKLEFYMTNKPKK